MEINKHQQKSIENHQISKDFYWFLLIVYWFMFIFYWFLYIFIQFYWLLLISIYFLLTCYWFLLMFIYLYWFISIFVVFFLFFSDFYCFSLIFSCFLRRADEGGRLQKTKKSGGRGWRSLFFLKPTPPSSARRRTKIENQ